MDEQERQRQKLQSLQSALDDQDAILIESVRADPSHELSVPQLVAIKGVFETISSNFPNLIATFSFYGQPSAIRSQIRAARLQLQLRIDALTGDAKGESDSSGPSTSVSQQLRALLSESTLTVEQIASDVGIEPRSIYRHLAGCATPRSSHVGAYQRVFSKHLKREVVIHRTSPKRQ
jgi:hypothetical protein